jgi:hypothetical protein
MTPEQTETWLKIQYRQMIALEKISEALDRIAPNTAPNHIRSIKDFRTFNWASIKAEVIAEDDAGATVVKWNERQFLRRSPQNKFQEAIWFSQCTGKEGENNIYERLITFKQLPEKVDELPSKVKKLIF